MTKVLFVCHGNIGFKMLLKDRLQRIAFARILSDLIEADSIIEDDEMSFLEDLNERFRISLINNSIPLP